MDEGIKSTTKEGEAVDPASALLGFLRGKLDDAEKSLRSREAMANPPRISEEEWERLKAMPGNRVTKGRKLSKAALKEIEMEPQRHKRIAIKCRHDVEMFRAAIDAVARACGWPPYVWPNALRQARAAQGVDDTTD